VNTTLKWGPTVVGEYEHDALGRRTKKVLAGGSSVRFYHDGFHDVEEYDGSGNLLRKYVYRPEIDSIAMMEAPDVADVDNDSNTSELVSLYFHFDGRTNVSRLTAAAQTVVESYETDPYGNLSIKDKNGNSVSSTQAGNPFTLQRRRLDGETGLMYFRARMYHPSTGHWLQRDPAGFTDGTNLHETMSSDPVNRSDPFGNYDNPTVSVESKNDGKLSDSGGGAGAKGPHGGIVDVSVDADPKDEYIIQDVVTDKWPLDVDKKRLDGEHEEWREWWSVGSNAKDRHGITVSLTNPIWGPCGFEMLQEMTTWTGTVTDASTKKPPQNKGGTPKKAGHGDKKKTTTSGGKTTTQTTEAKDGDYTYSPPTAPGSAVKWSFHLVFYTCTSVSSTPVQAMAVNSPYGTWTWTRPDAKSPTDYEEKLKKP